MEERRRDQYRRLATERGYRSRSSFKLIEIDRRYKVIKAGDVVVDLGAAPGGWMQVAMDAVGGSGVVLGVDLKRVERLPEDNAMSITGDLRDPELANRIRDAIGREADVVLCDASPSVSGAWDLDHAIQLDLVEHSLAISKSVLKEGGTFLTKVFQGDLTDGFVRRLKDHFEMVQLVKPKASRSRSAEIYVLARGFKKTVPLE